ncbi:hypothetical protein [Oceanicaulis sp. UBA2681]|mgnify:CR=1 FL=1|uniref:hypothetical protein n=1 Tax=Oceanicaulis sp. UBA2681 TaxID=1947007 RepID=UPI00257CF164|nr:hypothetical protein [Oceanicaulis sp. UBA2681]|tara:strand:+ start:98 stop:538 length:441 start_codon:yes stop_codon:yes gene_type:complete
METFELLNENRTVVAEVYMEYGEYAINTGVFIVPLKSCSYGGVLCYTSPVFEFIAPSALYHEDWTHDGEMYIWSVISEFEITCHSGVASTSQILLAEPKNQASNFIRIYNYSPECGLQSYVVINEDSANYTHISGEGLFAQINEAE